MEVILDVGHGLCCGMARVCTCLAAKGSDVEFVLNLGQDGVANDAAMTG